MIFAINEFIYHSLFGLISFSIILFFIDIAMSRTWYSLESKMANSDLETVINRNFYRDFDCALWNLIIVRDAKSS